MDNKIIKTFDELMASVKNYIKEEENIDLIKRAYRYAYRMHDGQMRKSGDPYIVHPLNVAYILSELRASPMVLAAGLLHDVIEDTEATYDDICLLFDLEIADLVRGVTNLKRLKYESREEKAAQNFQKLFLAMAKDIRVIIIKIADRLHNIRTLFARSEEAKRRISKETIDIFVPIIHRLGMYKIKAEIEDKCFKYLDPDNYENVKELIKVEWEKSNIGLDEFINSLQEKLTSEGIKSDIKGRVKTIHSVHKKMVNKNKEFTEIFDLFAIRIIVDTVGCCYETLGLIQQMFKPIPKRFKDYIAMPKPNLYQSLHTTIIAPSGKIFEVQIRTKKMDEIAEGGVAAHWAYKENSKLSAAKQQKEILAKLPWFKKFVEYSADGDTLSVAKDEFFNVVMEDLLTANVFVLTPNGRVVDLPSGATVIDFAYKIHTDIGHKMVGATINGKIVPLAYEVKTGQVCEIRTSKRSFGPSEDWLKVVKTRHAKNKIRQFFKSQNREEKEERGKEKIMAEFSDRDLVASEHLKKENALRYLVKYDIKNESDLYYAIETNVITAKTAVDKIIQNEPNVQSNEEILKQYNQTQTNEKIKPKSSFGIVVPGITLPYVKIAKCCMPIPGDEITGIVTKGSGIVVHTVDCHNIGEKANSHAVEVYWDSDYNQNYEIDILITAFNRSNLLSDIINVFNKLKTQIKNLNVEVSKDEMVMITLKISVKNVSCLEQHAANLKKIADVYSVERLIK